MNEAALGTLLIRKPIEVVNRLAELGWTADELIEVASAMVRARHACTQNHPSSAPGWFAWAEGTNRLRELGLSKGLVRADDGGIPWTLDRTRGIRFVVVNTDDGTGVEDREPQNRSKKGPGTDRAVDNNQSSFINLLTTETVVPISRVRSHPGIIVSWYLCVYCEGDLVRAELSCPVETEAGFFADFAERIFVISDETPSDSVKRKEADDTVPEFDITVTRK